MSTARDDEFVVTPEMAEVAAREGLPLHAGERVRFTVVDSAVEPEARPDDAWPPAWIGSMTGGEATLSTDFRTVMREELGER